MPDVPSSITLNWMIVCRFRSAELMSLIAIKCPAIEPHHRSLSCSHFYLCRVEFSFKFNLQLCKKKLKDSRTEIDVIHVGGLAWCPWMARRPGAVGKKIRVLHISWFNSENMTLVIVLNNWSIEIQEMRGEKLLTGETKRRPISYLSNHASSVFDKHRPKFLL